MRKNLLLKRYSDSLFQISQKKKKLETVYKELLYIQKICDEESRIIQIFDNPLVSSQNKIKILLSLTKNDKKSLVYQFFLLLLKNKREYLICEVINQFLEDYLQYKKIKKGVLVLSQEISKEVIEHIERMACKLLSCQKIILKKVIMPSIIGGFILKVDSFYLDASIKSKYIDLSKKLKKFFKLN